MDDQRRSRSHQDPTADPAEGVRIIGPDEAAEAMDRPDVATRRSDAEPRFGDRPPAPPAGPRPALRFPLDASADPTRIERPPVQEPTTGPVELPHWTEPPTGEVPAVLIGDDRPLLGDDGDDLDAWSSFATSTPHWRDADDQWEDDGFVEQLAADDDVRVGALGGHDEPSHVEYFGFDDLDERVEERTGDARWGDEEDDWSASGGGFDDPAVDPSHGEVDAADLADDLEVDPGTDWNDDDLDDLGRYDDDPDEREGRPRGGREPVAAAYATDHGGGSDRDMTMAIGVGIGLVGAFLLTMAVGTKFTVALVAVVLALAAGEYFAALRKVGWEAAPLLGIAACALFPLAVYWRGIGAFGLLGFLLLAALLCWFLFGAGGSEPRLLEGSGATLLGVTWIGGLGATAAAMLRTSDGRGWLIIAVLGAVAYDIGGLFLGRAFGHRPLSSASPNKTLEGLVAGMGCSAVVVLVAVGMFDLGPWDGAGAALALGVGAAVAAPLGDLCQSMLKRDLGIKDMGSLLPGHGGVFDRFDSLLFVLPVVFWLTALVGRVG